MASLKKRAVVAAASTYIDPADCDSTISYKVVRGSRLWGSVQLSDCNRKIDWFFRNDKTSLSKIDRAIEALQAFRAAFAVALAEKPARRVRKA